MVRDVALVALEVAALSGFDMYSVNEADNPHFWQKVVWGGEFSVHGYLGGDSTRLKIVIIYITTR